MGKLTMVVLLSFLAARAHAGPNSIKRIVTAAPRAVGRTAENMLTFKDRSLALHQWVLVAAIMANAGSEVDLYSRCQNCHELDTAFYGLHPSGGRVILEELAGAMFFSTVQQGAWESSYEEHSSEWRAVERWAPTALPVLQYTWLTYRNTTIPSDGSRLEHSWLFP